LIRRFLNIGRLAKVTEELTKGAYWQVVDSGEVVYVDANGNMRFPEAPSYEPLPDGLNVAALRSLPNEKLYESDADSVRNATDGAVEEARKRNVSLLDVGGTGEDGRITKQDVVDYAQEQGSEEQLSEQELRDREDLRRAEEAEAARLEAEKEKQRNPIERDDIEQEMGSETPSGTGDPSGAEGEVDPIE
jgi:pyruvate/2-oxoglutarate dehydrogenase complex dihydrolipoamide acyltransferase (E2) component